MERDGLLREIGAESRKSAAEGIFLLQAMAERSGMNPTDLQCIAILTATGPITAGRLAEEMGLTTGAITGLVNRMERLGYVRREKDPADGRRVVIRPIPEELERAGADLFGPTAAELGHALAEYDDRELAVILDFMRRTNTITEQVIARLRRAASADAQGELASPIAATTQGRLVFANGTSRLTLRAENLGSELYRARFEGSTPKIDVADGVVTIRYPKRFFGLVGWRDQPGEVTMNAAVPWAIEVRGGAYQINADLTGLQLASFSVTLGFSEIELILPRPFGTVPIRLSGGASKVTIRRPTGIPARARVRGGVGLLVFDNQQLDAFGGTTAFQSPDYDEVVDRYEIDLSGGASEIAIR